MVTTHLCQLLGFVALEDPHAYRESALRAAKAAVFAAVRPLDPDRVVFGQYDGYRDEPDVAPDSDVETLVAIEMWIDNDRWRDVPFYLRTGKAMADGRRTITIRFTDPRHRWLKPADGGHPAPNELVIELADQPRIAIDVRAKRPGPDMDIVEGVFRLDLVVRRARLRPARGLRAAAARRDARRPDPLHQLRRGRAALGDLPAGARPPAGAASPTRRAPGARRPRSTCRSAAGGSATTHRTGRSRK